MKDIKLIVATVVVLTTACVVDKSNNKTVEAEMEEVLDTANKDVLSEDVVEDVKRRILIDEVF